ncbi:MAG: CRISPR-associated endonuclease Cas3'', partial [Deltaproteobacteria bacterium]|nr:CRISPR-associated endonuclease Cas3'' [Deltaproteobacteria bacterium]
VRGKKVGQTKRGDPFLSITLSDRTGDIEARVWDNALELSSLFREGDIIEVQGQASSYKGQIQLTLSGLRVSEEGDPSLFLEISPFDISEMMTSLRGMIKKIGNVHLRNLSERFLSDHVFVEQFKRCPAAKNFHHNYIGGLLEHTLSVCRMSLQVAEQYPRLDKDLLLTGAFLHDIGKTKEFRFDRLIDYTDEGRLLGHVTLGVAMLDEKLAGIKKFPEETALRLKHLVLSHHGEYEFGSPKRPKFLEAFALHMIDDLDAKMNGIARYMEKDAKEGSWTEFNRMFDRYLLKGDINATGGNESDAGVVENDRQGVLFRE